MGPYLETRSWHMYPNTRHWVRVGPNKRRQAHTCRPRADGGRGGAGARSQARSVGRFLPGGPLREPPADALTDLLASRAKGEEASVVFTRPVRGAVRSAPARPPWRPSAASPTGVVRNGPGPPWEIPEGPWEQGEGGRAGSLARSQGRTLVHTVLQPGTPL